MRITDFDLYRDLLQEQSGLFLTPEKSYLLDSRLAPVAKKWGYPSVEMMAIVLQGVPDKDLVRDIVEAMAPSDTSFFRDETPFSLFRDAMIPALLKARAKKRSLRIWSAACSSGQEAYSLAMILKDYQSKLTGWKVEILATDISGELLDQAKEGLYSQFEVQRGLGVEQLLKHFDQTADSWKIHKDLTKMVRFQPFNLLDSPAGLGHFDIIFCRNLLRYFDEPTQKRVAASLTGQLEKDGFLVLGDDEHLGETPQSLQPVPGGMGVFAPEDSPLLDKAGSKASQALA